MQHRAGTGLLFALSFLLAACSTSVTSSESGGGGGGGSTQEGGSGGGGGSTGTGGSGGGTTTSTTTAACVTPDSPAPFELGTGEKCFERLTVDQEVPLQSGPQGGYHMWLAVGCADCQSPVHLRYGAHDPATNQPLTGTYDEEAMVPLSGDWPQAAGLIVHMPGLGWDPENDPPPAKGTKIILWSKAFDGAGAVIHEAQVEIAVGDIVEWNPCVEDPNNPICQTG